jgi:hypothetical protein
MDWTHLIAFVLGANVGLLASALCVASRRGDGYEERERCQRELFRRALDRMEAS